MTPPAGATVLETPPPAETVRVTWLAVAAATVRVSPAAAVMLRVGPVAAATVRVTYSVMGYASKAPATTVQAAPSHEATTLTVAA